MRKACMLADTAALVIAATVIFGLSVQPVRAGPPAEQLIVFIQSGGSAVNEVFEKQLLPPIRQVARKLKVPVTVVDAGRGAPAEVVLTPLLVYQNHRGRSIYQGRTTTARRIRNFIRTARFVPQGKQPLRRQAIPILATGRSRVWAPLKVAPVTGTPPPGYDQESFVKDALEQIEKGFSGFKMVPKVALGRADRGFYMDFYPWRAADGTLFLSLALYSQFHCKAPVFEKKKPPLIGPWKKRRQLFRQAAALLEAEVIKRVADPLGGDGFDPLPADAPVVSWAALGLDLPPAPVVKKIGGPAIALTADWTLATPGSDDPPLIQFRFPAPLDQYTGEVTDARGHVTLSDDLTLEGATGSIMVRTDQAVTMGEPVLDEAIKGSMLLSSRRHPSARFVIRRINADGQPIAYGHLSPARISGDFTLKAKTVPLNTIAEIEPVIGVDGRPRLLIRGRFQIDLRRFDIEGADGPAPARHTLVLDYHLVFVP